MRRQRDGGEDFGGGGVNNSKRSTVTSILAKTMWYGHISEIFNTARFWDWNAQGMNANFDVDELDCEATYWLTQGYRESWSVGDKVECCIVPGPQCLALL